MKQPMMLTAWMCGVVASIASAQPQSNPVHKAHPVTTLPNTSKPIVIVRGAGDSMPPFGMAWHTIDGGGGPVTNGAFQLNGTVGQPEPCVMLGGAFEMTGGYWFGSPPPPPACYPDCDGDMVLSVDDFICFQTMFALSDPYADCDQDLFLSIDDFICFQTLFALGC